MGKNKNKSKAATKQELPQESFQDQTKVSDFVQPSQTLPEETKDQVYEHQTQPSTILTDVEDEKVPLESYTSDAQTLQNHLQNRDSSFSKEKVSGTPEKNNLNIQTNGNSPQQPVVPPSPNARQSLNTTFNLDDEDLNSSIISNGWPNKQNISIDDAFDASFLAELQSRELKIKELHSDKQKLKALLRKAREVIDSTNSNYKGACEQIKQYEVKLLNSEASLKSYQDRLKDLESRRSGIQRNQVAQILARIKVGETGYTLIQSVDHAVEWYRDNLVVNIQEQLSAEWKSCGQINYGTIFTELKTQEKQLTDCMTQYEERLNRVNQYMEQSNQSYLRAQEELKQVRLRQDQEQRSRDSFITNLIDKSAALKQKCLKSKARESLSELEINLPKLMELKPPDSICTELRDHVLDIYQRITINLLKHQIKLEESAKKQESDWQKSCDALIEELQKQKLYASKQEDTVENLMLDLAKLKSEHYKLVAEHGEHEKQLKVEQENSINYEYVKNILISYFTTTDSKVHENLLRVVFSGHEIQWEEQQKVMEAFHINNQSLVGKMIGGFF